MADIPKWRVHGDWFDTCNCSIPCPWAMFIDERADQRQREALQMIFGGRVGGWPGTLATWHRGGPRFPARSNRVPRRWADRRRHRASECKCTTPRQTPSASSGTGPGGRASTSDSSGQGPTSEAQRVPAASESCEAVMSTDEMQTREASRCYGDVACRPWRTPPS